MTSEDRLEKTTHVLSLLDLYDDLLTAKQQDYLNFYYQDDLSLSEIAEELGVSRNAVFDQIRRATRILEDYEEKLHLLKKHQERLALIDQIETEEQIEHDKLEDYLQRLKEI